MLEIIGNEILPNLYIKSVEFTSNSTGEATSLKINVSFFDYIDEDRRISAFGPDFLNRPNINLNVIICKGDSEIRVVLSSTSDYSMYDLKNDMLRSENLPGSSRNEVYAEKSIYGLKNQIQTTIEASGPDQLIEFVTSFDFTSSDFYEFQDLECYAFFSYDISKEEDVLYLDVDPPFDSRCLNGPISSEILLNNGGIKTTTNRFTIDSVDYPGPVHFHNGEYMEGSQHTEALHRVVQREVVPNPKVSFTNYSSLFEDLQLGYNNEAVDAKYFSRPFISVGKKYMFGFFSFNVEKFFMLQPRHDYFINSSITMNYSKIRNDITLTINGEPVEITEILINHEESNEMFFYFKVPFGEYTNTDMLFSFKILDQLNFFKQSFLKIHQKFYGYIYPIQSKITLAEQQGLNNLNLDSNLLLKLIKAYVGLVSFFKDLDSDDLIMLKKVTIASLYKSSVPINTLNHYFTECETLLGRLMIQRQAVISANPAPIEEEYSTTMALGNYKNAINYLGDRELVHPDIVSESLTKVNGSITKLSGLFQNAEQFFLPAYIRNDFNALKEVNYGDLFSNISLINTLTPEDVGVEAETETDEGILLNSEEEDTE